MFESLSVSSESAAVPSAGDLIVSAPHSNGKQDPLINPPSLCTEQNLQSRHGDSNDKSSSIARSSSHILAITYNFCNSACSLVYAFIGRLNEKFFGNVSIFLTKLTNLGIKWILRSSDRARQKITKIASKAHELSGRLRKSKKAIDQASHASTQALKSVERIQSGLNIINDSTASSTSSLEIVESTVTELTDQNKALFEENEQLKQASKRQEEENQKLKQELSATAKVLSAQNLNLKETLEAFKGLEQEAKDFVTEHKNCSSEISIILEKSNAYFASISELLQESSSILSEFDGENITNFSEKFQAASEKQQQAIARLLEFQKYLTTSLTELHGKMERAAAEMEAHLAKASLKMRELSEKHRDLENQASRLAEEFKEKDDEYQSALQLHHSKWPSWTYWTTNKPTSEDILILETKRKEIFEELKNVKRQSKQTRQSISDLEEEVESLKASVQTAQKHCQSAKENLRAEIAATEEIEKDLGSTRSLFFAVPGFDEGAATAALAAGTLVVGTAATWPVFIAASAASLLAYTGIKLLNRYERSWKP